MFMYRPPFWSVAFGFPAVTFTRRTTDQLLRLVGTCRIPGGEAFSLTLALGVLALS